MSPATRRATLVALVALLGIVLAAAITWGTSQLVRQRIALSGEPLTAGRSLLPRTVRERSRTTSTRTRATPAPTTTSTIVPPPATTTTPIPTEATTTSVQPSSGGESSPPRGGRSAGEGRDSGAGSAHRDD